MDSILASPPRAFFLQDDGMKLAIVTEPRKKCVSLWVIRATSAAAGARTRKLREALFRTGLPSTRGTS